MHRDRGQATDRGFFCAAAVFLIFATKPFHNPIKQVPSLRYSRAGRLTSGGVFPSSTLLDRLRLRLLGFNRNRSSLFSSGEGTCLSASAIRGICRVFGVFLCLVLLCSRAGGTVPVNERMPSSLLGLLLMRRSLVVFSALLPSLSLVFRRLRLRPDRFLGALSPFFSFLTDVLSDSAAKKANIVSLNE